MLFKLSFSNLKKSIKDYAIYFFTLILGVAIFYIFNAIETQTAMLEIQEDTREIIKLINTTLSGVSVFVAFVLGFLVIYASNFLMKRRKKEFALYIILGMGKRKISSILFIETLIIGVISLGIGLVLGIGLSQLTSIFVAGMFDVSIEKYKFVFSNQAFIKTLLYFCLIYVVVILFNTFCINKYKLIDLLQGGKKSEKTIIRNPFINFVIFSVAIAMLAFAYYKVCDMNNVTNPRNLMLYIAMGCIGTFLFFWSLSGILFSIVHSIESVYFKGLNSFVFKQMNSRINSNVLSMTVICLMMFITICVLSSGLTVRNSMTRNLKELAPADVGISKELYYEDSTENEDNTKSCSIEEYYKNNGIDIISMLDKYENVYVYDSETFNLSDTLKYTSSTGVIGDNYYPEDIMKVSDYNKIAEFYGNKTYELNSDEYMIIADFKSMVDIRNTALQKGLKISIDGKELKAKYDKCQDGFVQMSSNHINTGIFLVPDELMEGKQPVEQWLVGNYKSAKDSDINEWDNQIHSIEDNDKAYKDGLIVDTKISIKNNTMGLGAMVAFIALYIGLIFLISGAAILALKELSESADNMERYKVIKNLGADNSMLDAAVLKQTILFFGFPMLLAIIHSIFGMRVSYYVIQALGTEYMVQSIIITALFILVIYGGYFVLTYNSCKNMIKNI